MASFFLDPVGDIKADGTEVPAGTAASRLDSGVRQPTVPGSSEYVEATATGQVYRLDMATRTLAAGETVVCARGWVYVRQIGAGRAFDLDLFMPSSNVIARRSFTASDSGWLSIEVAAPLTQAQLDALSLEFVGRAGTGQVRFGDSGYVHLFTRTDVWQAANDKLLYNRDPVTGLSVGAGWFAGDVLSLADLGGGWSFGVFGDSNWATAPGQQPPFASNPSVPAAPNMGLFRNAVMTMDSYDVEEANFAFYAGSGPATYFPDVTVVDVGNCARWPLKTFVYNDRLWVVGHLTPGSITVAGTWAAYCDNYSSHDPDAFAWTYLPNMPADVIGVGIGDVGVWENDGYMHLWSIGNVTPTMSVSLYRLPVADFHDGDWLGGEWWNGTDWDSVSRENTVGFLLAEPENGASCPSVEMGSAGLQLTGIYDHGWTYSGGPTFHSSPPYHIAYALTPDGEIGKFNPLIDTFEIPEGERWTYQARHHPHLTWDGMGPNDQVWSYATNNTSGQTWDSLSRPRFVQALDVAPPPPPPPPPVGERDVGELMIASSGDVYTAPVGTPLPTLVRTPLHASFYRVGYVSEDGISLMVAPEIEDQEAWQESAPVRRDIAEQRIAVTFDLLQWNAENVVWAFGGRGAVVEFAPEQWRYDFPGGDAEVDERSIVIDWQDGDDKFFRLVFARGTVLGGLTTTLRRSSLARLPVGFDVLAVDGSGSPGYLFLSSTPGDTTPPPEPEPGEPLMGDGLMGDGLLGGA